MLGQGLPTQVKFSNLYTQGTEVETFAVLVCQARTQALHHGARGKVLRYRGRLYETNGQKSKFQHTIVTSDAISSRLERCHKEKMKTKLIAHRMHASSQNAFAEVVTSVCPETTRSQNQIVIITCSGTATEIHHTLELQERTHLNSRKQHLSQALFRDEREHSWIVFRQRQISFHFRLVGDALTMKKDLRESEAVLARDNEFWIGFVC